MERVKLEAQYRENISKPNRKALRKEGRVPGSLSIKGADSVHLEIELLSLIKALKTEAGARAIIDLQVSGAQKEASGPAIIKEIQKDYLGRRVVHVAFSKVAMDVQLTAPVSIVLHGNVTGATKDGGTIEQVLQEVEVKCLPAKLPPHLDADVSDWEIGYMLHTSDLNLPPDVELAGAPDAVVAVVRAPHIHAEPEVEAATEEAVEEAPAAEAEE